MRIMWIEDDPDISIKDYFGSEVFSDHQIESIIDNVAYERFL